MENTDAGEREDRPREDEVSVICTVDVTKYELDVSWTSGALFCFNSDEDVKQWIDDQNRRVEGSFHLKSDVPGDDVLVADYYVQYRPPG